MNKVLKEYKQSLEDLKKINGDLFYDELKVGMNLHLTTMRKEAEKVEGTVQIIKSEMEKMNYSFQDKTEKSTNAMSSAASQINATIAESLEQETQQMTNKLGNIYNIFHGLVEDQKQFVENDFIGNAKALLDINVKEITAIQSKMKALLENQTLYIENKEKNWHEQATKWEVDLKEKLQKLEKLTIEKLNAIQESHEQLELSLQTSEQATNTTMQQGFEHTAQHLLVVKDTLKESEHNYQVAIADQKESYQLAIVEQQQLQQDKLTTLEIMQAEQGSTMHKWLIGLSISQVVSIGAIAGLYFF
ncbi:MAG: hypothetical protein RR588_08045 [Solibacillus sp.]